MVRAVGQDTFQPKIGFKTRYGIVANPFAEGTTVGAGLNVTQTYTTEELRLQTLCNKYLVRDIQRLLRGSLFLCCIS